MSAAAVQRAQPRHWPPRPRKDQYHEARVSKRRRCPICGSDDQCMYLEQDAQTVWAWCIRGEGRPDGLRDTFGFRGFSYFFELDARTLEARPAPARYAGRSRDAAARKPVDLPTLTPAQVDEALRLVARAFPLTPEHCAKLEARGYDLAACGPEARHVFASLPADVTARYGVVAPLVARLAWADEAHLLALPGIEWGDARRRNGAALGFLPLAKGAALLEFRRDTDGRLWSLEYAPDAPSDPKRKRLAPLGAPRDRAHVARPRQDAGRNIWIAEGGHKANLLADAYSAPALATLGKGAWRHALPALEALDPERQRLVVVALDTDAWGCEERQLVQALMMARRRVAVARWDAATGKGPDDALAAGAALTVAPVEVSDDLRRQLERRPRVDRRVTRLQPWQRSTETDSDRAERLATIARQIAERTREHLTSSDPQECQALQVITAAPGLGKSHAAAQLGMPTTLEDELDLAWIAQRRDMVASVAPLRLWRQIEPCDGPTRCANWRLHEALGKHGYNTHAAHEAHRDAGRCDYERQFYAQGGAVYQVAHVKTSYPARHAGIVIDELDLAAWLPARQVTLQALQRAMPEAVDSYAGLLLRGLQAILADAATTHQTLQGRAFFEALDARMDGRLDETLAAIAQTLPEARPWPKLRDDETPDEAALRIAEGAPVTFPPVARALVAELLTWRASRETGAEWNSLISLRPAAAGAAHAGEWALAITEPLRFALAKDGQALPPITLLDATADADLLARLFCQPVRLEPADVPAPPAHTRHIAVRTGKRYGKRALTHWHGTGLETAAREVLYILRELDPDGALRAAGKVGLVTFEAGEAELAQRLDIAPERAAHFFAVRGSNALEGCEVLLIVGTPTLPEGELYRMARALWADDAAPIAEGCQRADDGRLTYADARVQRLSDYLTESELAQCAHRVRPLRHDGRVIVSYCVAGDLAYLPATTVIERLPRLTATAEDQAKAKARQVAERLERAACELRAMGAAVNVATLQAKANLRRETILAWLRTEREPTRVKHATETPAAQNHSGASDMFVKVPTSLIESHKQNGNLYKHMPPPRPDAASHLASDVVVQRAPTALHLVRSATG